MNEQFTLELAKQDELLARYVPGELDFASVACSHTNMFFAAAKDERPCFMSGITRNGKLSPVQITAGNPQAAEVFSKGLKWTVFKFEAEAMYPVLPEALGLIPA